MNEQEFKNRVAERWGEHRRHQAKSRRWVGAFLLIVGGLLLARAGGVAFPNWFFTWPVLLIGIGFFSGIRHGFRGIGWLIPILIGGIFLADYLSPQIRLRPYLWPIILMGIGLMILFRPKKKHWRYDNSHYNTKTGTDDPSDFQVSPHIKMDWQQAVNESNDVIDATAIFGGVKKNILSKNFKGGDVTTFMGGAEINLMQADFNGKVMIDCFNMFGGTKLLVPSDWDVQSGVVTIFGGIEDKRTPAPHVNQSKVLYLDGTCIFGGIEIKSF